MQSMWTDILEQVVPWLLDHGLKILAILALAYLTRRFGLVFVARAVRGVIVADDSVSPEAEAKREETIVRIFTGSLSVLVWAVAALMVLQELGLDITPLLAAAGVAGIALGFAGQYLIRDLISGLFIIIENQYHIGDVVCFGETCGLVEDVSLRLTTLRDIDGVVHHVPHGEIKTVSNLSKKWARVNLDVGVAYSANLQHVIDVVNRVGQDLAVDTDWKDFIIKPPQFLRVNDFADSAVMVKILGETKPLKQWAVTGELRKRLKIAFDAEGIEIPFPQRVLHQSPAPGS